MKTSRIIVCVAVCVYCITGVLAAQEQRAQSDLELITETLMHYIEGTANGEPDRLRIAFHPDFNLYTVTE